MLENFVITKKLFFQSSFYAYILIFISILSIFLEGISYAAILPLLESYLGSEKATNLSRILNFIFEELGINVSITSISIIFIILIFLKNFVKIYREYLTANYKYLLREIWLKKFIYL